MPEFLSDQPVLDLTEEADAQTLVAIDDGIAQLEAGRGIPLEEMRKELARRCSKQ
jgi:hypothetical protein